MMKHSILIFVMVVFGWLILHVHPKHAYTHRYYYFVQPTQDAIELNPDKVAFIEALRDPETGKIQK